VALDDALCRRVLAAIPAARAAAAFRASPHVGFLANCHRAKKLALIRRPLGIKPSAPAAESSSSDQDADYTQAIAIDPDIGDYAGRGYAWKNLESYEKAIDDLKKAIQLDPSASAPMQQLADIDSCSFRKIGSILPVSGQIFTGPESRSVMSLNFTYRESSLQAARTG
jgi:tetratricopeptide (TPR) repeat protein